MLNSGRARYRREILMQEEAERQLKAKEREVDHIDPAFCTIINKKQCPKCGGYFEPRGIAVHIRYCK